MKPAATATWTTLCAVIIAALAIHDVWRRYPSLAAEAAFAKHTLHAPAPSGAMIWAMAAALFIAHSLRLAAAADNRAVASYTRCFEQSWKLMCQLILSALFMAAAWLVLYFGARLLEVVSIGWFLNVVTESPGHILIFPLAFAIAMHITDQRPSLVVGARTLLLVLFSWLLPVATLLIGGFLLGLPVVGMDALWSTHEAAHMLLIAAAVLIILINAAFQDGSTSAKTAKLIRASARVASVELLFLTALAAYALYMRVHQHGWSARRMIVAYGLAVAVCYAVGYAHAALQRGRWLPSLPRVNIFTACLVLSLLVLALSPILDPARLAARLQLARFDAGEVNAEKIDVAYLRYDAARYGTDALAAMNTQKNRAKDKDFHEKVEAALAENDGERGRLHFMPEPTPDLTETLKVWPKSAKLPASYLRIPPKHWDNSDNPLCLSHADERCDVFFLDVTGDGKDEMIVLSLGTDGRSAVLQETPDGKWKSIGEFFYRIASCKWVRDAVRAGSLKAIPPLRRDIEIAGRRVMIVPRHRYSDESCER